MVEVPDFLPLGSIVTLKGNSKKLMVISRALALRKDDGSKEYFDYGLCIYPNGLIGDAVIYSNHDCVESVFYRGFEDEENEEYINTIAEVLPKMTIPKANPMPESEW